MTSQHFFQDSHNFDNHGGTFANVAGDMHVNTQERSGLKLLLANITQGAFHDSSERGKPPKCYPHTRVAILSVIMKWLNDPQAQEQFILWLYGPAGSGKTSIGQTIAEACVDEDRLAASFFFGKTAPGRNTPTLFVATLAYQLSRSFPETEDRLLTAIEEDQTIFSRALSKQMQKLVIEPLKIVQPLSPTRCVVIDAIDECGPDGPAQADLLEVLSTAVNELRRIHIKVFITSRFEYEVRRAFSQTLNSLTKALALDEYQPDNDIKTYFLAKFQEIKDQQDAIEPSSLPTPWPNEEDVNYLIDKASGQFIFASTVIKFIDSRHHSPNDRLKAIRNLSYLKNESPFAPLDALYRSILSSVADLESVLQILTLLMLTTGKQSEKLRLSVNVVQELLGLGSVRRILMDMHALVYVPPPVDITSGPRIHHVSR
ncbi:hypothetical protein BJ912DRAFT_909594, partial [Pholiota molesta]